MNLLTDPWIPVRPLAGGTPQRITLQVLLCHKDQWVICLPRDDMELAALQLLICLLQVTWIPKDVEHFRQRIGMLLSDIEFQEGVEKWGDTFRLDHSDAPFMQVKGVTATDVTGMEKLLAGLTGATNCTFVNEPGQGDALCAGCAAIALFNQANNAPSFGGGFKSGLRGGAPVTTLIQGDDLRTTLWLNVLMETSLDMLLPEWKCLISQRPTWQDPIQLGDSISAMQIGLLRGLFWQPDHIELCPPEGEGQCTGCGLHSDIRYTGFLKAKFNFTVNGIWFHPHSPRLLQIKKGVVEEKFLAFTTSAPSWTQISRILVAQTADKSHEGRTTAAVVKQLSNIFPNNKLRLIVGGYRNNQASILERRHDVLAINQGWERHLSIIEEVISIGQSYKTALRKALFTFVDGIKNSDIKGAGIAVHEIAETQYYRQSDLLIPDVLASLDFDHPEQVINQLKQRLHSLCEELFEAATAPYAHHPKLIIALAVARRGLQKYLSELKSQEGAQDGQTA